MPKPSMWFAFPILPVTDVVASDKDTIECTVALSEHLPEGGFD